MTAERRKRRGKVRVRTLAGGGVLLGLLFWLGDDQGWFTAGGGSLVGVDPGSSGGDLAGGRRAAESDARPGALPDPDAQLAFDRPGDPAPGVGSGGVDPSAPLSRPAPPVVGDAVESKDRTRGDAAPPPASPPPASPPPPPTGSMTGSAATTESADPPPGTDAAGTTASNAARVDAALGLIAEFERALAESRLADLAGMVDRLNTTPLQVPDELEPRLRAVRARVDADLLCAPKLRDLLRQGRVLQARRLLEPIRQPSTPAWLRQDLDRAARGFGWPPICRADTVVPGAVGGEAVPGLPQHRRIRCVLDGQIHEDQVWGSTHEKVTLRRSGAAGFRYPRIDRSKVEPVDPTPAEALAEGLAAAQRGDALGVVLWSCHLHEADDRVGSTRLRRLMRAP
jgi:hypothetical protein